MSTQTFEVPSPLERLIADPRVRIGGLIAGALVMLISVIVGNVANAPSRSRAIKAVAVLPDAPLNIPIIRSWPYPPAPKAVTVTAPGAKVVKTARR